MKKQFWRHCIMKKFNFENLVRKENVAVDFGNNNIVIAGNRNKIWSQPCVVTLNGDTNNAHSIGKEAYAMIGKAPEKFKVIRPMRGGVIADFFSASKMLKAMIKGAFPHRTLLSNFNYVITGVPFATTEVERRALRDTMDLFRSSKTFLLFEPIAAAIGLGLDIHEPDGKFLVDIGGGITEAVVISLSGVVTYRSIKTGGDNLNYDIQQYFRKNYNIDIGMPMAERVKIEAGAAEELKKNPPEPFYVVGKDTVTGIPKGQMIDHVEIAFILNTSLLKIEQAIIQTLEECPPELAGDIYNNGIHLTGGSSLLRGFADRLARKTKIPVHQDDNALLSVSNGISTVLKNPEGYKTIMFR